MSRSKSSVEVYLDHIAYLEDVAYDVDVDAIQRMYALIELARFTLKEPHKSGVYLRDSQELMVKHGAKNL